MGLPRWWVVAYTGYRRRDSEGNRVMSVSQIRTRGRSQGSVVGKGRVARALWKRQGQ